MARCPLAVQLCTFRHALANDAADVIARVADMGIYDVEPACATGSPDQHRTDLAGWAPRRTPKFVILV